MEQWKEDLINAKEKLIFVNYKRGEGATTTILNKILKTNKNIKVLYIGSLNKQYISEKLRWSPNAWKVIHRDNYVKITKPNNIVIELIYKRHTSRIDEKDCYDICISDCVYTIVPEFMFKQCEQVIMIMPDLKDLKIINSNKFLSNQKSELSFEEQIKLQKIKLLKELDGIPCNQNTTITREKIVGMLKKLNDMESGE